MTLQQAQALRAVAGAFIEAVKAGGSLGVPGGVLYAAVIDKVTLAQFQQIMGGLVRAGKLSKRGECYHFVADL
jgi:hypothetical protein